MRTTLVSYSGRPAPRYTSYPTAPHFTPLVSAGVYRDWLANLSADDDLSVYIHVPYCREICWYCGCNTAAVRRDDLLDSYVDHLKQEIALVAAATPARRVAEIHWGGGTPNILSVGRFNAILEALSTHLSIAPDVSHAMEFDPRAVTRALSVGYAAAGVGRASLGVQTFDPQVQAGIGRVQPTETVRAAVEMLREAGIGSICMDLMYGLPHQTVESLEASVETAAGLAPDRISLFGYAHVPWFKKRQRLIDETALPGAEARYDQCEAARRALLALGYVPIGLDHFARPDDPLAVAARAGTLCRNFQGYVPNDIPRIIGLGPSAITTLPQGLAQNASEVGAWRRAISAGRLATARGHASSDEDRTRQQIIQDLMCRFSVDLGAFGGAGRYARELEQLSSFAKEGIVSVRDGVITIAPAAHAICRLVAQVFDAYAAARHSPAI